MFIYLRYNYIIYYLLPKGTIFFMSNLYTFMGGIRLHYDERERGALKQPIAVMPAPAQIEIAFPPHGQTSLSAGERVYLGQRISDDASVKPIHSSVSGKISKVKRDDEGYVLSVVIKNDGEDTPAPSLTPFSKKLTEASPEEIVEIIRNAGICETGEGLSVARRIEIALGGAKRLMIDCTECEPFLASRGRLILERAGDVLNGAKILLRALEMPFADIVIDNSDIGVIRALEAAVGNNPLLRIRVVDSKHPQSDKKLIVNAVCGKEIPPREANAQVGYVVFSAEVCADVFYAFAKGMPQIRKLVTVAGDAIARPRVFDVPIGTRVLNIVEYCGGYTAHPEKIVRGGVMRGVGMVADGSLVDKADYAFLFLTSKYKTGLKDSGCIRCGECVQNCPMHLMPLYLANESKKQNIRRALAMGLKNCIECGTCTYSCPGGVEHVHYIRGAKAIYNSRKAKEAQDD